MKWQGRFQERDNKTKQMKYTMKTTAVAAAATLALALGSHSALALNITIGDGLGSGGSGVGREVGETEPNTVNTHSWDLEAMVIKGNKLVLIGGFDFKHGNGNFQTGDLFIDSAGGHSSYSRPSWQGDGYKTITGGLGYEYVLDFKLTADLKLDVNASGVGSFNVLSLGGSDVQLQTGYYKQNDGSNPFRYKSGGTDEYLNKTLLYRSGLTTAQVQADYGSDVTTSGNSNYALELDMSWWNLEFPNGNDLFAQFTIGCGNDVMHAEHTGGSDRVPDAGSSLMLLGFGITGLALAQRRLARKA